jgi:hypothetical protein
MTRTIKRDGAHTAEVLAVLASDIPSAESRRALVAKAAEILTLSVDPGGGPPTTSDGLVYGLIQSGKTSVITVTAAMAAENGFGCIIILTSDTIPLYAQTLERIRASLRGLTVVGKKGWEDPTIFERQIRNAPLVIVCSKNGPIFSSLMDALKRSGSRGAKRLAAFIIDDEADQASLNTFASKNDGRVSTINDAITELRSFFPINTYLQVTATPQALFLQRPEHDYRPSFTVLTEPGEGYVGGDDFFASGSPLLRSVDLLEVEQLRSTHQPDQTDSVPPGLRDALLTFFMGAAARNIADGTASSAFLCHVSHEKVKHRHLVDLIDRFKEEAMNALRYPERPAGRRLLDQMEKGYKNLLSTQPELPSFEKIVDRVRFLLPGANIKLIDSSSKDAIELDHVFSIFVGGNKLGRGVTIKNLIVSYYGRNPKKPNTDTVLQHARMYGYRRANLGVTRLFLPDTVADHFRIIHQMESALREHLKRHAQGDAVGLYISSPLRATRANVLDPNSLGVFVAGHSYNPAYPLRTPAVEDHTAALDALLMPFTGDDAVAVAPDLLIEILGHCVSDPKHGTGVWDSETVQAAVRTLARPELFNGRAFVVVRRGRALNEPRRETQGILSGGEESLAPRNAPTLFIYRQNANSRGDVAVWWPQVRFPDGSYWLTFSFNR